MTKPISRLAKVSGFTLIELLIVVAIIAILAAIAVPNFLEAQTRAKVSRGKADMRSIATAIEAYQVDNNRYPPSFIRQDKTVRNPVNAAGAGTPVNPRIQRLAWITTPIAYMTSIANDPFAVGVTDSDPINKQLAVFTYWDAPYSDNLKVNTSFLGAPAAAWIDMPTEMNTRSVWSLISYGPDKDFEAAAGGPLRIYDATNGTVSSGDIWRIGGRGQVN